MASPFACLDVDDTFRYGPETITISQVTPGVYRYYVYDYLNRGSAISTALGLSNAKVEFYANGTLRTFFVPTGVGNAWAVFEWNGTSVTVLNQLYTVSGTPTPPAMPSALLPAALEELQRLVPQMPGKPPR